MAKAFEFQAIFPTDSQPIKLHGEGGGVALFEFPDPAFDVVMELYKLGHGKNLRVLVEVES